MTDEALMRRALELAERGRYSVSPNPMVGCVIARDGVVLAEGWHRRAGGGQAVGEVPLRRGGARRAAAGRPLKPLCQQVCAPPIRVARLRARRERGVVVRRRL